MSEILGAEVKVPCYHHQAIRRLGRGVEAVGWADDGTIEAAVVSGRRFATAVQWHPEDGDDPRLFRALIGRRPPAKRLRDGGAATLLNPATEQVVDVVPHTSAQATDEAIARSRAVSPAWRAVAPADRARLLRRFAEAVDGDIEHLAALEVANSGHTIGNARWEAGNVRDVLLYYSAAPERLFGRQIPVPGGVDVTFREPIGVVGVIVPWNFPLPIAGWGWPRPWRPATPWSSSPPR